MRHTLEIDPTGARKSVERWMKSKVATSGDCWEWQGSMTRNGYGQGSVNGRLRMVHRVFYVAYRGPVALDLDIDHLCRNRICCNPAHLEPVTRSENLIRTGLMGKYNTKKTHCPHGHEYTPENTHVRNGGRRYCRACARINAAKKREQGRNE